MAEFKEEIVLLFTKIWAWLLYIAIGLIGKFSYDMLMGRRMTLWQALASTGLGLFAGFLASVFCITRSMEREGMFIVPVVTLLSEKLMIAVFVVDYKKTVADIFKYWADRFKK